MAITTGGAPAAAQEATVDREYRRVLSLLSEGDREAALVALMEMETRLTGGQQGGDIEGLWRAKLHVIRDLLSDQVEILVPILLLHHDAFVRYRNAGQPALALHSRTMTWELAHFYRKKAATEAAGVVAARVLASLGGYLQEALSLPGSAEAFTEALELDPGNAAARLGLAALLEKTGRYPEAVAQLRRLLEAHPRHAEGRLRLAINYLRTGDEQGEALLQRLAFDAVPAWIAVLAHEELAILYAERGRTAEAITVLRRATERFRDNQRLLLLLAFHQDRALDQRASLETARRASVAQDAGDTPRLRYNEWPSEDLAETRRLLVESATPRMRLLAEALRAAPGVAG
jgi:tetratricopeptide (TPR) repeat protein